MNYRALLIRVVTFLGGIYFFLSFILPKQFEIVGISVELGNYSDQVSAGLTAMGAMALGLGLVNLFWGHGSAILFLRKGWFYSLTLLLGLVLMISLSAYDWSQSLRISEASEKFFILSAFSTRIKEDFTNKVKNVPPYYVRQAKLKESFDKEKPQIEALLSSGGDLNHFEKDELKNALESVVATISNLSLAEEVNPNFESNDKVSLALSQIGITMRTLLEAQYESNKIKKVYTIFFDGVFVALGSAMFSLLGFYIASAAYRAFRIKSFESGLMMAAALLVILGQLPFALYGSSEFGVYLQALFPKIRFWLLTVPNTAAFRAINIGAEVAALIMAFRMWLSIESRSFAEKETKGK